MVWLICTPSKCVARARSLQIDHLIWDGWDPGPYFELDSGGNLFSHKGKVLMYSPIDDDEEIPLPCLRGFSMLSDKGQECVFEWKSEA